MKCENKIDLDTIAEHFERASLDDSAFFTFVSLDEIDVHIQFKRQQSRCWSIWYPLNEGASRQTFSRTHLKTVITAFRVNEDALTTAIAGNLLQQAAYADEFVRQIQELLGEDAVRDSIRQTQDFMDALRSMIPAALEPHETLSERLALQTLPEPDPVTMQNSISKSRLRIVRS